MKRLCFDSKKNEYVWMDYIPKQTKNFGNSAVQKKKYISDRVRINNQEVQTGNTRTALYTMPGGVDNGVRYSSLYEHSGLDITEINAVKNSMEATKEKVSKAIQDEVAKEVNEVLKTVPKANVKDSNASKGTSE